MTEIQDKNNREWKGCEWTFNTRKAFLKRRKWVHGAKLKKKREWGVPPTQGPEETDGAPEPSTLSSPATQRKRLIIPDPWAYRGTTSTSSWSTAAGKRRTWPPEIQMDCGEDGHLGYRQRR